MSHDDTLTPDEQAMFAEAAERFEDYDYIGVFDADAPHGPETLVKLPARYMSIICYPQG